MNKFTSAQLPLAFMLLSLSACAATDSKIEDPVKDNPAKLDKIGYYLPKSVFNVSASLTFEETKVAVKTVDGNWSAQLCTTKRLVEKDVSFDHVVVADTAERYELDPNSSFFRELTYTIELTDDGRLKGINASSTGKSGDFVQSIGSFIGRVLPFIFGAADGKKAATVHNKQDACESKEKAEENARAWFGEIYDGDDNKKLREEIKKLTDSIELARGHQLSLLSAINNDISAHDDMKKRFEQTKLLDDALGILELRLTRAKALKEAKYANFKKTNKILIARTTITSKKRFSLEEILAVTEADFTTPIIEGPIMRNMCEKPLESLTELWMCSGVALKFHEEKRLKGTVAPTSEQVKMLSSDKALAVVSRAPIPVQFERVEWAAVLDIDGSVSYSVPKTVSISTFNAFSTKSAVTLHQLDKSAWKKNDLQLVYNASGSVNKVVATTGGGADIFAKALDESLKGGLTAYAETLTGLNTIKTQEAELARASDKARLEQLKLDKELLDNEIALTGVNATESMMRERAVLDEELKLLQAQQSLANAFPEQATETARLNSELTRLKAQAEVDKIVNPASPSELDNISAQVLLLQQQQLLSQLQAPAPVTTQQELLRQQSEILQLQLTIAQLQKELDDLK